MTYVNDVFQAVARYTEPELIGQPHGLIRHPNMAGEALVALQTIGHTINATEEASAAVAAAVEEQNSLTQDIVRYVTQAVGGATSVSEAMLTVQTLASATSMDAYDVAGAALEMARQAKALRHEVDDFLGRMHAA